MDKAEDIISELFNVNNNSGNSIYSSVFRNWKYIIPDKRLADHCKVEDINGTQLIVSFDHQGWIQVFKMHQKQILSNLNRYLKNEEITSVRMIMRSEKDKYLGNKEKSQVMTSQKGNIAEKESYSAKIESIQDDELRKRLENLKKKLQGN